jgi:hypothetical protein
MELQLASAGKFHRYLRCGALVVLFREGPGMLALDTDGREYVPEAFPTAFARLTT